MKDTSETAANSASRQTRRAAYSKPALTLFGPVGALTQTGSGLNTENDPPKGKMGGIKRNPKA